MKKKQTWSEPKFSGEVIDIPKSLGKPCGFHQHKDSLYLLLENGVMKIVEKESDEDVTSSKS
jgi:hypothetical protein